MPIPVGLKRKAGVLLKRIVHPYVEVTAVRVVEGGVVAEFDVVRVKRCRFVLEVAYDKAQLQILHAGITNGKIERCPGFDSAVISFHVFLGNKIARGGTIAVAPT